MHRPPPDPPPADSGTMPSAESLARRIRDLEEQVRRLADENDRKNEELTRLTSELEISARSAAESQLQLTAADRLKSQFLANMSHELRTPLNSIIGFSGILETRLAETLGEKHARFLGYIHSSGQQLLRIINDILDLSKVEAGILELTVERFSVASVVEGVATVLRDRATQRGVGFETEVDDTLPLIEADPVRVKQILYNLLSNAVKFSYEGGTVRMVARRLAAESSPLGTDSLTLSVSDDGIGIDPADRELIFQEFHQVDGGTNREFEGTGLGLALVRRFVELHRGAVAVASAPGRGSTFTVTLPLAAAIGHPAESTPLPELPGSPERSILVVEDDPTAFERIRGDLATTGYRAVRARNGEDALLLARALQPLAITLDIVLPGMDGWEVLRQLKADDTTRLIPVIIVSMLDNRELGLTLGADDYFTKPVNTSDLTRRLGELASAEDVEPRVLLIDDDARLHDLVAESLAARNYPLWHAYSGREGLQLARRERPDIILLDLMMEGMDGFEVATALQDDETTADIPIVVLTAKEMTTSDRERLRGKIAALLNKGERAPSRLASILHDLVQRRQGGCNGG